MSNCNCSSTDQTPWLPIGRNTNSGWAFDIVGLLAVIGESTIADHTQAITASKFSWIPRLIPAPQALLKNERPTRLPSIQGIELVGVKSGTRVHELNYFANVIHDISSLADYEFREYEITYAKENDDHVDEVDPTTDTPKQSPSVTVKTGDLEKAHTSKPTEPTKPIKITIPMRIACPLNILTFLSTLMTVGLLIWAAIIHDGVACIAIFTISVSTCLACQSSQWRPQLTRRPTNAKVPEGDMVIKTRGAALIVVHCHERISRELYTGTEKCEYVHEEKIWSAMVATSTMLLMISVVLLGNCKWTMQAATGAAYIILNGLYWALPIISKSGWAKWSGEEKHNWDMSRYRVEQLHPAPAIIGRPGLTDVPAEVSKALLTVKGNEPSFTRTLAYAIQATKETSWVKVAKFAPVSDAWSKWLDEAQKYHSDPLWDPVEAKDRFMKEAVEAEEARQNDATTRTSC